MKGTDLVRVELLVGFFVTRPVVLAGPGGALLHITLAVAPLEAVPTAALIVVHQIAAGGVVLAGSHSALVDVRLAVGPLVAGVRAVAGVQVDPVQALAAIKAGQRRAVVNIDLAVAAGVAGLAGAGVVVDAVHTGGLVEAGALRTLVNVVLTVGTLKKKNRKINSDLKVNRNSAGNGGIFTMFGSMLFFLSSMMQRQNPSHPQFICQAQKNIQNLPLSVQGKYSI